MATKRDYYEVLGVGKDATADQIKAAYRKLAMQWHPDRWVNGTDQEKKTAEEHFKEAAEAYSVLSDPQKKQRYDQFGFAGMEGPGGGGTGFSDMDLNDILRSVFGEGFSFGGGFGDFFRGFGGGGQGQNRQRVYRGRDIRTSVKLTLEEIAKGCTKQITIERNRPCTECGGRGTKNASDIKTCPRCNGSGQVRQSVNSLFGRMEQITVCPQCGGEGHIISNPCRRCGGTGLERVRETVTVTIPAGVEDGMQLTVRGEGHAAGHGGTNGDLLVVIKEEPHKDLLRDGSNLFYSTLISVTDAMLGSEISVPCLDGSYKVKIEPGTQSGTVIKLRGKGLPVCQGYGTGDLFVKIMVWIPRKLGRSEREALESMRDSSSFKPDPNREDRILFDKEKNIF